MCSSKRDRKKLMERGDFEESVPELWDLRGACCKGDEDDVTAATVAVDGADADERGDVAGGASEERVVLGTSGTRGDDFGADRALAFFGSVCIASPPSLSVVCTRACVCFLDVCATCLSSSTASTNNSKRNESQNLSIFVLIFFFSFPCLIVVEVASSSSFVVLVIS